MMDGPIVYDLCCGLGGWTEGFLAEGYRCIGYDIEVHEYGDHKYPGELRLRSILDLDGAELADAACIVASPPCQEFSYMAMPWSRGKVIARALRGECGFPEGFEGSQTLAQLTALFDACFRIQREASAAGGGHIPLVIENVKGAQPWIGQAKANYGSFYLWGDIETVNGNIVCGGIQFGSGILRPPGRSSAKKVDMPSWSGFGTPDYKAFAFNGEAVRQTSAVKNAGTAGGSWFNVSHGKVIPGNQAGAPQRGDGLKTISHVNKRDGHTHARHLTARLESDRVRGGAKGMSGLHGLSHPDGKGKRDLGGPNDPRRFSSSSAARKAASALIAKIPFDLSNHIARCFKPRNEAVA